jgi:hypothetical protein
VRHAGNPHLAALVAVSFLVVFVFQVVPVVLVISQKHGGGRMPLPSMVTWRVFQ